jgi:hypothetical protein
MNIERAAGGDVGLSGRKALVIAAPAMLWLTVFFLDPAGGDGAQASRCPSSGTGEPALSRRCSPLPMDGAVQLTLHLTNYITVHLRPTRSTSAAYLSSLRVAAIATV